MKTVAELKNECDNIGIAYKKRAKKSDLIQLLEEHNMSTQAAETQAPEIEHVEQPTMFTEAAATQASEIEPVEPPARKQSIRELAGPIFNEMADAGKTRDEIMDKLMEVTGKSKGYVGLQYNMLCDFFGKYPEAGERAPRGKKADAYQIFEQYIQADMSPEELVIARNKATEEILKQTALKKASIDAHARSFMKMKGYELSQSIRSSRVDMIEKAEKIKALLDEGKNRADCVDMLVADYGHTPAGASSTYQNIIKAHGLQGPTRAQYREPCWSWFKENMDADRVTAIKQFVEIGASPAVASSYWNTFALAKELFDELVEVEEPELEQAAAA